MVFTPSKSWFFLRVISVALVGAVLAFAYGFWVYVTHIDQLSYEKKPADAIVVLTGESSRIRTGVELLEQKLGKRLLISGVYKDSMPNHLLALKESKSTLFSCCVDLGFEATSTVGNAIETQEWVAKNKYASLIVVTSAYHMPRAMIELKRELPQVKLLPFVVPARLQGSLWDNSVMLKRYLLEYVKFCAAWTRYQLEDGA